MKFKVVLIGLLTLGLNNLVSAQSVTMGESNTSFTIGVETTSFIFNGFEAEVGYNFNLNRLALSYSITDLPDYFNNQSDSFSVNRSAIDVSFTRFLKEGHSGLHYGLGLTYFLKEDITRIEDDRLGDKSFLRLGITVGYMWFPIKNANLYIEPALRVGLALNDQNVVFNAPNDQNDSVYEKKVLHISGPLLKVGWKFDLN